MIQLVTMPLHQPQFGPESDIMQCKKCCMYVPQWMTHWMYLWTLVTFTTISYGHIFLKMLKDYNTHRSNDFLISFGCMETTCLLRPPNNMPLPTSIMFPEISSGHVLDTLMYNI